MIIKGKSITGPEALGPYLQNAEVNEVVNVLEIRGTVSQDLIGALIEMDAYAAGTRCEKPLYHGKISPEPPYRLTPEQVMESVDALEKQLGLTGHARVVVMHEKLGRQHFHPVWARIDLEKMRAVPDSHNYRKHEEVARDLERRFGHPRVQGAHAERDGVQRPDRSPTRSELDQEERTGIPRKEVKQNVTECFRASDNVHSFKAAVENRGYLLGKGDRRDFVIVDQAGGIHSLPKMIEGMRTAELRKFMNGIDRESLPSATMAQEAQLDRAGGRRSALEEHKWNDELAKNAIDKDRQRVRDERAEAVRFREAAIKWEVEQKRLRQARALANRQKRYGQGDGYVSQSKVALKDHQRRQKKLNKSPQPMHPEDHRAKSAESAFQKEARTVTGNQNNEAANATRYERSVQNEEQNRRTEQERDHKRKESEKDAPTGKTAKTGRDIQREWESDEETNRRMQRRLSEEKWVARPDDEDLDPDRQHKASGGGRTRSR